MRQKLEMRGGSVTQGRGVSSGAGRLPPIRASNASCAASRSKPAPSSPSKSGNLPNASPEFLEGMMAEAAYDRTAEDLGNIVEIGHVNTTIPDQRLSTLFYITGLGLT